MGCGNHSANHFQPRLLNPGQGFRCYKERHPFLALTLSLSIGLHSLGLRSLGSKIGLLTIFLSRLRELERICM